MIYHFQFNSQSEHTNQIAEIILWYALEEVLNADFTDFLSAFKWVFNNSMNAFTDQILNEIIYEFNLTDFFDVITDDDAKKFEMKCKIHQQKAQDSIVWANLVMKNQYDRCHIFLLLNFRDLIMLKLHHEYCVSDVKNKKLFIQQVDCFSIKQQISSLAYKLKLSANMKIHSIMSVINFKLISSEKNLYNQSYNNHSLSVKKNHNINNEWKSFYIKKLLNHHLHYYKHDK